jgi:chromosome segregation ATPase
VDLIIAFLASMSGALIGAAIGIFVMASRMRPGNTAELDGLRGQLKDAKSSLTAATAKVDNLQKQIAEHQQAIQKSAELVKERDGQLESLAREARQTATYERQVRELNDDVSQLMAECTKLQGQLAERQNQAEAQPSGVSEEDHKRQVQELNDQMTALKNEEEQLRVRVEQESLERSALEALLGEQKTQTQEFAARITELESEVSKTDIAREREALERSKLETQAEERQSEAKQLALRISDLERELSETGLKLQQERESAAKGMELLVTAKENLSRLFTAAGVNGRLQVEPTVPVSEPEQASSALTEELVGATDPGSGV